MSFILNFRLLGGGAMTDYNWILAFRCLQARTLTKREVWCSSDVCRNYINFINLLGKNAMFNMAAQSQEAPPSEWKSQSLIGKVSSSLLLLLDSVLLITCSRLRMRTGWCSLKNTLFEQKEQHLWHICCPISLVISKMKLYRNLSEQFKRMWCFHIQSDRSCIWMLKWRFKHGRRVT